MYIHTHTHVYNLLSLSFFSSFRKFWPVWMSILGEKKQVRHWHVIFSSTFFPFHAQVILFVMTYPSIKLRYAASISSYFNSFSVLPQIVSSSKDACFISAVETLQQIRYVWTDRTHRQQDITTCDLSQWWYRCYTMMMIQCDYNHPQSHQDPWSLCLCLAPELKPDLVHRFLCGVFCSDWSLVSKGFRW